LKLQFLVYRKKKHKKLHAEFSLNLYSNRTHNFVKHLVAFLGRHGASADFLTLSCDRATLGAVFAAAAGGLGACDVIMKMVYYPGIAKIICNVCQKN